MRRIATFLAAIVTTLTLGIAQSANATTITFGNVLSVQSNTFPFGGTYQTNFLGNRYQQVYEGDVFGTGNFTISSISFYGAGNTSGGNADGTYTLSLSTTSSAVNGLSTNFAANLGPNIDTFFSGTLPVYPGTGLMTFTLATPLLFNPVSGNLLLDVQINGVTSGGDAFYRSENGSFGTTSSRMVNGSTSGTSSFGLVTSFEATPAATAVPEPTTLVLLGTGVVAAVRTRRRKNRA